jgi:hypothetical protein
MASEDATASASLRKQEAQQKKREELEAITEKLWFREQSPDKSMLNSLNRLLSSMSEKAQKQNLLFIVSKTIRTSATRFSEKIMQVRMRDNGDIRKMQRLPELQENNITPMLLALAREIDPVVDGISTGTYRLLCRKPQNPRGSPSNTFKI